MNMNTQSGGGRENGHVATVRTATRTTKVPVASVVETAQATAPVTIAYKTKMGKMLQGTIENALDHANVLAVKGKVDLILTSPPFPLVRKKRYGNETGEEYLAWLEALAPRLADLLSPKGSLVIELGNAWEKGVPVMSTLSLEALLAFKKSGKLHLFQHVICHNPARLPSPAEWVTVRRIRLKDSLCGVSRFLVAHFAA